MHKYLFLPWDELIVEHLAECRYPYCCCLDRLIDTLHILAWIAKVLGLKGSLATLFLSKVDIMRVMKSTHTAFETWDLVTPEVTDNLPDAIGIFLRDTLAWSSF